MYQGKTDQIKEIRCQQIFRRLKIDTFGYLYTIPYGFLEWSMILYIIHKRLLTLWVPISHSWKIRVFGYVKNIQSWSWNWTTRKLNVSDLTVVVSTVTPRSGGYGDVTATYIRRSEIPSRIYVKHQYRQESEYGSTWCIIHSNTWVQLQSYHRKW